MVIFCFHIAISIAKPALSLFFPSPPWSFRINHALLHLLALAPFSINNHFCIIYYNSIMQVHACHPVTEYFTCIRNWVPTNHRPVIHIIIRKGTTSCNFQILQHFHAYITQWSHGSIMVPRRDHASYSYENGI